MDIIINETGKREELHIYDNNGIDWVQDCIGNSGAQFSCNDNGEYAMTQDEYNWWADYLAKAQADYDEEQELLEQYGADAVHAIMDEEWRDTGNDYNDHHDINQRVFTRIRTELGEGDK